MPTPRVDAYASQPHYFDHIAPIWDHLEDKGTFYVNPNINRPGQPTRGLPASDVPVIVAGFVDYRRVRRPVVFVEHGAGENYNKADGSYSGGLGRDRVDLFLCPNQAVFAANESRYPGRSVIVGSPRLEWLARDKAQRCGDASATSGGTSHHHPLRVVVSFHWNCRIHPQAGTAIFESHPRFAAWRRDPRIELRGHSHPRIAPLAAKMFAAESIPYMAEFSDVVSWADVYAVDNSSTLFEAAALGLDVVVLDSVHYTPEETGWRFWKYADIGPRIGAGGDLVEAALAANHNRVSYDEIRNRMVAEVFGPLEGAGQRAADAIKATYDNSRR